MGLGLAGLGRRCLCAQQPGEEGALGVGYTDVWVQVLETHETCSPQPHKQTRGWGSSSLPVYYVPISPGKLSLVAVGGGRLRR